MSKLSRGRLIRAAGIIVVSLLAIWQVTLLTIANGIGSRAPQWALSVGATGADVKAAAAAALVTPNASDASLAKARALATSALAREPVNVLAVRTIGLLTAARGNQEQAEHLFNYSERLSRRDLATQIWMIESAVRANNINQALRHYDRALRTSIDARDLLFPVLTRAASEPGIAAALGPILAERPAWWAWFLSSLAQNPEASSTALIQILPYLNLQVSEQTDRQVLERVLARLIRDQSYKPAQTLYREAVGKSKSSSEIVVNGGFEERPLLPPFDWLLTDGTDLAGVREGVDARDGLVLRLISLNATSGEVAKQLLLLEAGQYALSVVAGNVTGDSLARPSITVRCDGSDNLPLELRLPTAPQDGSRVEARFQIPENDCVAQWLSISTGSTLDGLASSPWIDDVSIRPI